MKPTVNLLYVPGVNCHHETAFAFELAGGKPQIVLLNQILKGKKKLHECDILCLPGGFGYGDHIRAGVIEAIDLIYLLKDQLAIILEEKIPILGICNGFQVLAATGLLDGKTGKPSLILDQNFSTRFEHWRNTKIVFHEYKECIWTKGLDGMEMTLPVAHAEGRPVFQIGTGNKWQVSATYGDYSGLNGYPVSPNGSHIAAISNQQIMGLMPHPERRVDKGRHGGNEGLLIFKNGINAVK